MGVHDIFDEAQYTVPKEQAPMVAQALQCLGYSKQRDITINIHRSRIYFGAPLPRVRNLSGCSIGVDCRIGEMGAEFLYQIWSSSPSHFNFFHIGIIFISQIFFELMIHFE